MKRTFILLATIILLGMGLKAQEHQYTIRHDSLYVYPSWEAIFDATPSNIIINPEVMVYTPFHVEFDCIKKDLNKLVKNESLAVAIGDTLWYINSKWLKQNFKGECKGMRDYVPLYFSSKIAFVQWAGPNSLGSRVLDMLLGVGEFDPDDSEFAPAGMLYLLNFDNMMVEKVDSDKLSEILSYYPDLQRRYESMRDYKEAYIINDFFLQYVQRISQDPSVPYLF